MSVNNQDRYTKKCVLCQTRNAQLHSHFCGTCEVECKRDAGLRDRALRWLNDQAVKVYSKDGGGQ